MQIDLSLYGHLRDQLPEAQKGKAIIEMQNGSSVADLITHLGISRRVEVAINEELEIDETYLLNDGDQVTIFSAIAGG